MATTQKNQTEDIKFALLMDFGLGKPITMN